MEERRRAPRISPLHESVLFPAAISVRVVDVSVAGVLLQTDRAVERGTRGCLRLQFGGAPFAADIEVQRVAPMATQGYAVGATFVGITPQHRHMIEAFIS